MLEHPDLVELLKHLPSSGVGPERRGAVLYRKLAFQVADLIPGLLDHAGSDVAPENEERLIADLASAGIEMVAYIFYIIKRYLGQSARGAWISRARDTRPISVLPMIVRIAAIW